MKINKFISLIVMVTLLYSCNTSTTKPRQKFEKTDLKKRLSGIAEIKANIIEQPIRGFGGANVPAWANDLTPAQRETAFSPEKGLGLSVLRVRISHDRSEWLANKETIDYAKTFGVKIIASVWSAPPSMKTNNSLVGGKIKKSSYKDFAKHLRDFNTTVGGVYAICPINEPNKRVNTDSMNLTPEEVAEFIAAEGDNLGTKVVAPETYNMDQWFIQKYLANKEAFAKTDYVGGHLYDVYPYQYDFDKEVWVTSNITDIENGDIWNNALDTAEEIHDCMDVGSSMYNWWLIRRYYGLMKEDGTISKRGYVVSHFSKWIRPGSNKVSCTSNPNSGVYITAYRKDNRLVIVAINENPKTVHQSFSYEGVNVSRFDRYQTTRTTNWEKDSFSVSDGHFSINLQPLSVTTLTSL